MKEKIRSFLFTSARPETFNKVTVWILLGGSVLVFLGTGLLYILFLQFRVSFEVFHQYDVPVINFLFDRFYVIAGLFIFFVIFAVFLFPGLQKQKRWAFTGFMVFNGLLILMNLSFIFLGQMFNNDILYVSRLIDYLPEETGKLIISLNMSYFFQGVLLSLLHLWLIWRYNQPDMKTLFKIKD